MLISLCFCDKLDCFTSVWLMESLFDFFFVVVPSELTDSVISCYQFTHMIHQKSWMKLNKKCCGEKRTQGYDTLLVLKPLSASCECEIGKLMWKLIFKKCWHNEDVFFQLLSMPKLNEIDHISNKGQCETTSAIVLFSQSIFFLSVWLPVVSSFTQSNSSSIGYSLVTSSPT